MILPVVSIPLELILDVADPTENGTIEISEFVIFTPYPSPASI